MKAKEPVTKEFVLSCSCGCDIIKLSSTEGDKEIFVNFYRDLFYERQRTWWGKVKQFFRALVYIYKPHSFFEFYMEKYDAKVLADKIYEMIWRDK